MATFIVNTSADSGAGSLRAAIDAANGNGTGADVIFIDVSAGPTITLASDLPQIAGDVTIAGPGALVLTIDGAELHRVFWASSGAITIRDLTIANGLAKGGDGGAGWSNGGGGAGLGGGLFVDESADVVLRGVMFTGNRAEGGETVAGPATLGGGGGGGMDADGSSATGFDEGGNGGGPFGGAGGVSGAQATNGGDFSGGGGGWGTNATGTPAGHGGFGGGGGGYGRHGTGNAVGGFGGGAGGYGDPGYGGGGDGVDAGGGAGLGGAVFVRDGGSLSLEDVEFLADNTVAGGFGDNGAASHDEGSAEGGALFLMGGGLLEYDVTAGETRTLAASVETDGANLLLFKGGGGTLVLEAAHDADQLLITDGVLRTAASRLPSGGSQTSDVEILGGATLHVAQTTDATWTGVMQGPGDLVKSGAGVLTLTAYALHWGSTLVAEGTLRVTGTISGSATTVESGATLEGTGTVRDVTVLSGGTLAPGASPGVLATGDLTLSAGATFEAELAGTGAGQFDRVNVTGTVDLGGATLDIVLFGGFTPVVGNSFLLIDNDGADVVVGAFAGFGQGVAVTIGSLNYTVSYTSGTGNDVTLTVSAIPPPPPPSPPRVIPTLGGEGGDFAMLGAGDNAYAGGGGADLILGLGGDDVLQGNVGADSLDGGAGDDVVYGGRDDDLVDGGADDDWLYGDLGNDQVLGGSGNDVIQGGAGNDLCEGGEGADVVRGGQGSDTIQGGAGNDWLSGDLGDDVLTGGEGADTFHIFAGAGIDRVTDFSAADGDRVQLLPGATFTLSQVGADTVVDLGTAKLMLQNVQLSTLSEGWVFGA